MIKRYCLILTSSIFIAVAGSPAFAAACCGGGISLPALIVGDDSAQITASYTYLDTTADVDQNSIWYPRYGNGSDETLRLEAARVFSDRYQIGAMVPLVRRTLGGESSSGFGDVTGTLGYEYLPDWEYSAWRPRGLGFLEVVVPTGQPPDSSENIFGLDARGRGFWAVGAGTVLTKLIGKWDALGTLEIHKSFSRSYTNSQTAATLSPGLGGNLSVGGGYSEKNLRAGSALMWSYEDATATNDETSGTHSDGSVQRFATFTASLNYTLQSDWSMSAVYADQTLFGNPTNATLGRSVSLAVQKHWLR